jgi:hypothetical protein
MKLTHNIRLVPKLKIHGTIPPLPTCLHVVIHRDNFTFFSPLSQKRLMLSPCCLCIPPSTFEYVNQSMKIGMHCNWAHLNSVHHKSLPSECVSMCIPFSGARQRLYKHVQATTNTCNSKRIFGRVIFYAVRVLLKRLCLILYSPVIAVCW